MTSYLRAFDEGAKGELHGFFLHPASNLLRYRPNDPDLAAWSGQLYIIGSEVKPAPTRDNADGAIGAVVVGMARANSWEEAERASGEWAGANHWEIVQFIDDMRDVNDFVNFTAVSDAFVDAMGGDSQAEKYYQTEWEGFAIASEMIWDEE